MESQEGRRRGRSHLLCQQRDVRASRHRNYTEEVRIFRHNVQSLNRPQPPQPPQSEPGSRLLAGRRLPVYQLNRSTL